MVSSEEVQAQFRRLNVRPSFWTRAEIRELPKILIPGEQMKQVVMGWYEGGFALLCCTDLRVLLIDKKVLFLTLEDLRYEMIAEVMYQYRLLDATMTLTCVAKTLNFKSWNQAKLRQMTSYIQQRVMEVRQYDSSHAQIAKMLNDNPVSQRFGMPAMNPLGQQAAPADTSYIATPITPVSVNPYKVKPQFRRRRISRFITSTQVGSR